MNNEQWNQWNDEWVRKEEVGQTCPAVATCSSAAYGEDPAKTIQTNCAQLTEDEKNEIQIQFLLYWRVQKCV